MSDEIKTTIFELLVLGHTPPDLLIFGPPLTPTYSYSPPAPDLLVLGPPKHGIFLWGGRGKTEYEQVRGGGEAEYGLSSGDMK